MFARLDKVKSLEKITKIVGIVDNSQKTEDVLNKLIEAGALSVGIIGRELVVETSSREVRNIKKTMKNLKIDEFRIRESSQLEITVLKSGRGCDSINSVEVALMPATRLAGLRLLNSIYTEEFEKKNILKPNELPDYSEIVKGVLKDAGVTEALFTVKFLKPHPNLGEAVRIATLNALIDANGVIQI